MDTALMRQFSWLAIAVGLATTMLVWLAAVLGLFGNVELASADWRYRHVRIEPVPLSEDLAVVVIDDTSLETFGRWPWSREKIAEAIEELHYLGVKTLALDIQFSEPEPGADDELGAAVAKIPTVVGLDVSKQWVPGSEWSTTEGQEKWSRILRVLNANFEKLPEDVIQESQLEGELKRQYRSHAVWFRQLVIWQFMWEEFRKSGKLPSVEGIAAGLRGGQVKPLSIGDKELVEQLLRHARSWETLQQVISDHVDQLVPLGGHTQIPPIPQLAQSAHALGVLTNVESRLDTDDDKRRTLVDWEVPGGRAFQIGLVAAAAHQGLKPVDIGCSDSEIRVGQQVLRLRERVLYIDWPTSTFDGEFAKWTQSGMSGSERPAISIGKLLDLHDGRRKHLENQKSLDDLKSRLIREVAELQAPQTQLSEEAFRAAVEDVRMDLEGEQRERAGRFLQLCEAVDEAKPDLASRESELRRKLSGKLVFIGWTATGANADFVPTALDGRTPGVFVHVVAANMVLERHGRQVAPPWVNPLVVVVLGVLATLIAASLSVGFSSLLTLLVAGGWLLVAGVFCFNELDWIMPIVAPTVSPVGSWATTTAVIAVLTARDRARINRQFAARVSPQLVAKLSGDPEAVSMSGEEREITVMFGDLAGFTAIAEALGGPGVVRTLNTYLGKLSEELVARDAYVNKFLGDGFMAFWSAFGDEPRQESMAAESAVACQKAVAELGKSAEDGSPKISLRLGIATGEAVVGDCGAPPRLNDYTAIGDCVNLSARLESANKQFGTAILMDGPTHRGFMSQGGNPHVRTRALGAIVVVGQSKPVEIFEACPADADGDWIAATEAAVGLFREKRTADAEQAWRTFESKYGASKLSAMYLAAVEDVRSGEAPEDGVLHLRAK